MDTHDSERYREVAHAAAAWWAAKLTDRTPSRLVPPSDTSVVGWFSGLFADELRARQPVPDAGQIAAFAARLAEAVERHLSDDAAGRADWPDPASRRPFMVLACEFQPGPELAAAAEAAGVSPDLLPMKVTMRIHGDVVEAWPHYGGLRERVWPPAGAAPAVRAPAAEQHPAAAPVRGERRRGLRRFTRGELV